MIGAQTDSVVANAASAHNAHDTFAVNVGDEIDWGVAAIAAVIASEVAEGSTVDTNGNDLITSLNGAFTGADDGAANIEAGVIAYTGGEQFFVVDINSSQTITTADLIIQLTGTVTGLTLGTDGDALIA